MRTGVSSGNTTGRDASSTRRRDGLELASFGRKERKDDLFDSEKIRAVEAGAGRENTSAEHDRTGPRIRPVEGTIRSNDQRGWLGGRGIRRGGVKSKDPSKTNEGESTDQGHTRRSRTIVGGSKVRRSRGGPFATIRSSNVVRSKRWSDTIVVLTVNYAAWTFPNVFMDDFGRILREIEGFGFRG